MAKMGMSTIKKIKKDIPKDLKFSKKALSKLSVSEISVCHQNTDDTKWGRGMSIKKWASEFDNFESQEGAAILEKLILVAVNVVFRKKFLQEQLKLSKARYHGYIHTPYYHQEAFCKHDFVAVHRNLQKNHTVRVKLFAYLIPGQGPDPCWYKGSVQVNNKWQIIKWRM